MHIYVYIYNIPENDGYVFLMYVYHAVHAYICIYMYIYIYNICTIYKYNVVYIIQLYFEQLSRH